MLILTCHIT